MTEPFSLFPTDLLALIFTFINFRIINLAKRLHTNPETVYALFSVAWGIVYAVLTTPFSYSGLESLVEYFMSFGPKVGMIALATSGVWHRYKQMTGRDTQEKAEALTVGVATGISIAEEAVTEEPKKFKKKKTKSEK